MEFKMQNLKDLYNDILAISQEISIFLKVENFEKIEELLDKRAEFIKKISSEHYKIEEIKKIIEKIKLIDDENFAQLSDAKKEISKKMRNLSKNIKIISFYKMEETNKSRLVDERN